MRWRRLALAGVCATTIALAGLAPAAGQNPGGEVRGVVYHDLDGDGVRDQDEPGLPDKGLGLRSTDDVIRRITGTDAQGSYVFSDLPPGDYVVEAALRQGAGVCALSAASFDPLMTSWCFNFTLPWHAKPAPVTVTIESAEVVEVDLGAQPADVAVIAGIALLEDDRAPPGTLVEALVDGQECGTTEVLADDELNFGLHVLGEQEGSGCAAPGDQVRFRVGGVEAAETLTFLPFAYTPGPGYDIHNVVAMQDHAWYWMELYTPTGSFVQGSTLPVQALVGDEVCGETIVQGVGGSTTGFSRLIVPSADIQHGCGRPGAMVSFRVGGVLLETTVSWQPGLQQIELLLPGQPSLTPTLPPELPDTGNPPVAEDEGDVAVVLVLAGVAAVLLGGGSFLARRR